MDDVPNGVTGGYSCPSGYTSVEFARAMRPEAQPDDIYLHFCYTSCTLPTCGSNGCGIIVNSCGGTTCPSCGTDYSCVNNQCQCNSVTCNQFFFFFFLMK